MKAILDYVSTVLDTRQERKVLHKISLCSSFLHPLEMRTTGWKWRCLGGHTRSFCEIIWNSQTESPPMTRFRVFLRWYHRNFWKTSRSNGDTDGNRKENPPGKRVGRTKDDYPNE